MIRGEIPIELGASWFSPKCVEAQRLVVEGRGKALFRPWAARAVPKRDKLRILPEKKPVRRWGISFIVKRETAQTTS